MAEGMYEAGLAEVVGALQNRKSALPQACGHILQECTVSFAKPVARAITRSVFKYTMELLSCDLIWLRRYSHEPPGRFASLSREESRIAALQTLRGWCSCFLAAEATAADKGCRGRFAARDVLSLLPWASAPWVKEVFVALDEAEFKSVPADILNELEAVSACFKTSIFCERSFNYLRDRCRHSKAGITGMRKRYHALINSPLMEDSDRPNTYTPSVQAAHAPRERQDKELFSAQQSSRDFSLGEDFLTTFMAAPDTMGSGRFLSSNLAWAALQQCQGQWHRLETAWHSLLARKHQILHRPEPNLNLFVLETHPFGVLGLRVRVKKLGGSDFFAFAKDVSGHLMHEAVVVDSDKPWRVRPVTILPPEVAQQQGQHAEPFCGICMYVDPGKKAKSLVAAAAADAFIGVTLPQMGRLLDHYSVPHEGRRPISEYDMASCLVKWQFPALSKDEVEAIVQTRSLRSKPVFASALTPDNVEVQAQDEGEEGKDQVDSMMQQADHYVKSLKEQAKVKVKPNLDKVGIDIAGSGQTPASSSGPLPSALSWKALPTLPEAAHDQQTASKFLPVVKS